ncbi:aminotransferase, partial [Streptomyces sp. BG9H]
MAEQIADDCVPGNSSTEDRAAVANRGDFDRIGLRQGGQSDAVSPETTVKVLDRSWVAPLVVGPLDAPARPGGELAVIRAAAAAGLPSVVSAFAERTFAELASAADIPPWLRTFAFQDRETARHIAGRAEEAGFGALLLALGDRDDVRARRVAAPAELDATASGSGGARPGAVGPAARGPFDDVRTLLRTRADWSDVAWLRSVTALPLLVAGIGSATEARRALDAGADGIVAAALDALPEIAETVAGRCPVLLSGGVRRGADILASLASGADAVVVGAPVLD